MQKQLIKMLTVAKDLPVELKARHENDDNGFWLYASREVVDSTGDLVRIDGIDLSTYHDPANGTHLKILAQHIRALPNGMAPVIAKVTDYVKTMVPFKGKLVKALALYCEWLQTDEGKLLPLSRHYKDMVESGGIDSGSIGIILDEYKPLEETGGLDIIKSSLFETSLVTIAANSSATVIKEKLAEIGYELDEEPVKEPVAEPVEETKKEDAPHTHEGLIEGLSTALRDQFTPLAKTMGDVQTLLNTLADRIDTLESAVVILTQARTSQGEDQHTDAETEKSLATLKTKLDGLLKFIGK